jgi:hypothetical protein
MSIYDDETVTVTVEHEFPFEQEDQYAKVQIRKIEFSDGSTRRDVVLSVCELEHGLDAFVNRLVLDPDKTHELTRLLTMAADEAKRVDAQNNDLVTALLTSR